MLSSEWACSVLRLNSSYETLHAGHLGEVAGTSSPQNGHSNLVSGPNLEPHLGHASSEPETLNPQTGQPNSCFLWVVIADCQSFRYASRLKHFRYMMLPPHPAALAGPEFERDISALRHHTPWHGHARTGHSGAASPGRASTR